MRRTKAVISFLMILFILSVSCLPVFGAGTETDELFRYGYSTLTDKEKLVYDAVYKTVTENEKTTKTLIDASWKISAAEMDRAVYMLIDDHPELFWVRTYYAPYWNGTYITGVEMYFLFEGEALRRAKQEVEKEITSILRRLPADADTNYEKALYIHDTLVDSITYEEAGHHQTVYGALVDKKCVCMGYASAYSLLLQRLGIPASVIRGDSTANGAPESHAWNLVWTDEDTCVYVDVTHDDNDDGNIYHGHFNLSRDEINETRTVNSFYTLPECSHTNESYYDLTGTRLDSFSVPEVAALFGPAVDGKRVAVFECNSAEDLDTWLNQFSNDLYGAIGGTGQGRYAYATKGKEIVLTATGTFSKTHYSVSVKTDGNASASYGPTQLVRMGEAMEEMTFYAHEGYYFPENYLDNYSPEGFTVTRKGPFSITVSGTPESDATLTLPNLALQQKVNIPSEVTLTATGYGTATLGGLKVGMKYAVNGGDWTDVAADGNVELTVTPDTAIYVVRGANGVETADSDIRRLTLSRAAAPTVKFTAPTAAEKGSILTDAIHEYSVDGKTWQSCDGALTGLEAGTYYVRTKANGGVLASEPVKIVITAYVAPQPKPTEKVEDSSAESFDNAATKATEASTRKSTQNATEAPTDYSEQKSGCGAAIGGTAVTVTVVALAFAFRRKED